MTETQDESGTMTADLMTNMMVFFMVIVLILVLTVQVGGASVAKLRAQLAYMVKNQATLASEAAGNKADAENARKDAAADRKAAADAKDRADAATKTANDAEDKARKTKDQLDAARKARSIAVMFAIDTSASMGKSVSDFTHTMGNATESFPEALWRFKVGFVPYRQGNLRTFGPVLIKRRRDDRGKSIGEALEFVESVDVVSKNANIVEAVQTAMKQLDGIADGSRQCLVIIADTSATEMPHYTSRTNARLIAEVRRWANSSVADRRVLALYTGADNPHRDLFVRLGQSNAKSVFGTNSSDMFPLLFNAAFKE